MPRCLYPLLLVLACAHLAKAEVTFSLTIVDEVKAAYRPGYGATWYYALPALSDTTTPLSYHSVESPAGVCSVNFGTNTDLDVAYFASPDSLLNALTNGDWKLRLNRDTPLERLYTFSLATGTIATNSFGQAVITAPANGGINVTSNTPFLWTGPTNFDGVDVNLWNLAGDTLAATATTWSNAAPLPPGTNFFSVAYFRDVTTNYAVSCPTNTMFGALTNWTVNAITLKTIGRAGFITEGLAPSTLGAALDSRSMIWETGGDANWFSQAAITHDGVDAARSGPIGDSQSTTLRTVIFGTNTITFWWRVDCEDQADYVEFTDSGTYVADLTGASGWQQFTYHLDDNEIHVLEWTYYKDASYSAGADAAFVDRVSLSGEPAIPVGEPLTFSLTICRERTDAFAASGANQTRFRAFPALAGVTNPLSYHRVESPGNFCSANFGSTNSGSDSGITLNFADLANELTNGTWKVWLNRETPQEQSYLFRLTALTLSSNDLGVVTITAPPNGATNLAPHPPYQWIGLPDWDNLYIEATQERFGTNYDYAYATPNLDSTSWLGGPALSTGTNQFCVRYRKDARPNFLFSTPFLNWTVGNIQFESTAYSGFIVTAATPVQLIAVHPLGPDFQFQFLSQAGRSNLVQSCTDLLLGLWQDRTNFAGDGMIQTIILPMGDEPVEFFRVVTQ